MLLIPTPTFLLFAEPADHVGGDLCDGVVDQNRTGPADRADRKDRAAAIRFVQRNIRAPFAGVEALGQMLHVGG